MRWRRAMALTILSALAWAVSQAAPASPPPAAAKPAPARATASATVATVGGVPILRQEFEQRVQQGMAEYRMRAGSELPANLVPVVRRQLLESLIRRNLLILEARRRGALASEAEAIEELKKDPFFQPNGKFDPSRFDAVRLQQPDKFAMAVQQMRENLAARKLASSFDNGPAGGEAAARARATRNLQRVTLDALVLRRQDYSGLYTEPRESEVLAWYRDHAADYQRPERAVVSIVFVNEPASDPIRREGRADSALKAIAKGATLEQLAPRFNGLQRNVEIPRNNLPGYWKGDDRSLDELFKAKPGSVLPRPIAGRDGLILVRLENVKPAAPAPLRDVAREIRSKLRIAAHGRAEDAALRAMYEASRDSLKGTGLRVRWAMIDTAALDPGQPSASELDRWYRAHLADYSYFDSKAGRVVERPLSEVRDDAVARWRREQRQTRARATAEGLRDAWSHGRHDASLERGVQVHEAGPVLAGAPLDSTLVGRAIADTLAKYGTEGGAGLVRVPGGQAVFAVTDRVTNFHPPFEQIRPQLARRLTEQRHEAEERGARALYDANPASFATGRTLHYSRLTVRPPELIDVTMTHDEVARWHRDHLDQYSAPELVTASHILVSPKDPTPAADAAARARADSLLQRVKAGEDFATLAQRYSDDDATRENGGDLGAFGRGAMLIPFETAAFAMKVGEISNLVKTEAGYHIIKVRDHLPAVVQPLPQVYSNVSADLARVKADTIASHRADSLARVIHTPAQARAAARRLGIQIQPYTLPLGQPIRTAGLEAYNDALQRLKPGQMVPGTTYIKGQGWAISWADSITNASTPDWEGAHMAALERYHRLSGERAFDAKRAELDSMLHAGWSLDSLGGLYGGLVRLPVTPGAGLPGMENSGAVDSVVFGEGGGKPLAKGAVSPWLMAPLGAVKLTVEDRSEPSASQVSAEIERERRRTTDVKLEGYFEGLKKRYPVRILDPKLRAVPLPAVPTS